MIDDFACLLFMYALWSLSTSSNGEVFTAWPKVVAFFALPFFHVLRRDGQGCLIRQRKSRTKTPVFGLLWRSGDPSLSDNKCEIFFLPSDVKYSL